MKTRYYQGQLSQSIFIYQALYSVCSLHFFKRESKYMKLSLVSAQWVFAFFSCFDIPICTFPWLFFTCKKFCNYCLPDLSINTVATHEHTHTHTHTHIGMMLLCLKFYRLCYSAILKTLSNYGWGGVRLSPNYSILSVYRQRIRLRFKLPGDVSRFKGLLSFEQQNNGSLTGTVTASVEIVFTASHSLVPRPLIIWVYEATPATVKYKHPIIVHPHWVGSSLQGPVLSLWICEVRKFLPAWL